MHILILNFNPLQALFIQRGLRYENIGADICQPENLAQLWYGQYEAIVMPLQAWKVEAVTMLSTLRSSLGAVPLLITSRIPPPVSIKRTIKQDEHTIFVGTHLPFHTLSAELKKLINQKRNPFEESDSKIQIADLILDLESRLVERQKKYIYLRSREFSLLTCLMQNANKVLTRTFLLENVWDRNTSILSNTVDVHMSRLRKKIDGDFTEKRIHTIPCIGYKFIA